MSSKVIQLHNLPLQPTPFIGRESEIAEIVDILRDNHCRLLTLVGAGGMGKTRLAIECAKCLTPTDFEHGIYYVPLAPLTSSDDLVTTVINVLGITIGDGSSPQRDLVKFLSQRNLLLVMDNFEHVLDGVQLVIDILNHAPDVKIMVTSRETLNLQMERLWYVRGMPVPDSDEGAEIEKYSALQLFVDRAGRVQPKFDFETQQACVTRICQLVGGMPLGIELAASWLKTLSCQAIIKQIDSGIDILTSRARDIPEEHRSIRAVFDHSWQLLSADEQTVFPRLSVFHGGFTLEAATRVVNANLKILSGLVEKSMVRRDENGRYDLHELLRQYADEKLNANQEVDLIRSSHCDYFADFMHEHAIDIKGRRQLDGLDEIQADFENIRIVWNDAIENAQFKILDKMAEGLTLFCDMRALYHDGQNMLNRAWSALQSNSDKNSLWFINRLQVRWIQISLMLETGLNIEVLDHLQTRLERCLSVAKELPDIEMIALVVWSQAELKRLISWVLDAPEDNPLKALSFYEKATKLYTELDDKYYLGRILRGRVFVLYRSYSKRELAKKINLTHIELTRAIGDYSGLIHAIVYHAHHVDGKSAKQYWAEVYELCVRTGDSKTLGVIAWKLAQFEFFEGNFERTDRLIQDCINLMTSVGVLYNGMPLVRAVVSEFLEPGSPRFPITEDMVKGLIQYPSRHIGIIFECFICILFSLKNKSVPQYVYHVLQKAHQLNVPFVFAGCLGIVSLYLAENGSEKKAIQLLGLVSTHDEATLGWMKKWDRVTKMQQQLKSELGDETYNTLWEEGTQLDFKQTIEDVIAYFRDIESVETLDSELLDSLTDREQEVLELLAQYECDRTIIADILHIGKGTVRTHISHIYGKLDVKNCSQAVLKARRLGLV